MLKLTYDKQNNIKNSIFETKQLSLNVLKLVPSGSNCNPLPVWAVCIYPAPIPVSLLVSTIQSNDKVKLKVKPVKQLIGYNTEPKLLTYDLYADLLLS